MAIFSSEFISTDNKASLILRSSAAILKICCILSFSPLICMSSPSKLDQIYAYNETRVSWKDAVESCSTLGGNLARIDTPIQKRLAVLASLERDESDVTIWLDASNAVETAIRHGKHVRATFLDFQDSKASVFTVDFERPCLALVDSRERDYSERALWAGLDCSERHSFLCELPNNQNMQAESLFKFSDTPRTWHDAAEACSSDGGSITPIDSFGTYLSVSMALINSSLPCCWIGESTFTSSLWPSASASESARGNFPGPSAPSPPMTPPPPRQPRRPQARAATCAPRPCRGRPGRPSRQETARRPAPPPAPPGPSSPSRPSCAAHTSTPPRLRVATRTRCLPG